MISVVVVTRNRPQDAFRCLNTLSNLDFKSFEILLIDQSPNLETAQIVRRFRTRKLRYFYMPTVGKSKGLNLALQHAKGQILAFTDDDCLVSHSWLGQVEAALKDKTVAGVFGNTLPYQPEKNAGLTCPSIFQADSVSKYDSPHQVRYHYELGMGNNMALRTQVLRKLGGFKVWLGPGSTATAGDDSEIIFRFLSHGYSLATAPSMVVYHNRWLQPQAFERQKFLYVKALFVFYSYYLFSAYAGLILKYIWDEMKSGLNIPKIGSMCSGALIGTSQRVNEALV